MKLLFDLSTKVRHFETECKINFYSNEKCTMACGVTSWDCRLVKWEKQPLSDCCDDCERMIIMAELAE